MKTWATAPPLKTMVLTGSMVSGREEDPFARAQDGRVDEEAVLVDQACSDRS